MGISRGTWVVLGGPAWGVLPLQLSMPPVGPKSQPLPSGAQQGSKEGWAGNHPPPRPPSLLARPDAFGAWRQGLENGAAINSVRAAGGCKTSGARGWNAQGSGKDFLQGLADSIFGAPGSKGISSPFPPPPRGPAARVLSGDVCHVSVSQTLPDLSQE